MQCLDSFVLDALYKVGKELIAVLFVFGQRVFLVVASKTDTGLEHIHLIEVVSPLGIEYLEIEDTFDLLTLFRLKRAHLLFIEVLHHTQEHLFDLFRFLLFEVFRVNIDQQFLFDKGYQFFKVIVLFWHTVNDICFFKQVLYILCTVLFDLRTDIELRVKQLVPESIDRFTLVVGNVIIL